MADYLLKNIGIEDIKRGYSPDVGPDVYMGQLQSLLSSLRRSTAGVVGTAASRAGYVPQDLAARLRAIQQAGETQAAAKVAQGMSAYQYQRLNDALSRYLSVWGMQEGWRRQDIANRNALLGSLGGGLMSLVGLFGYRPSLGGSVGVGTVSVE